VLAQTRYEVLLLKDNSCHCRVDHLRQSSFRTLYVTWRTPDILSLMDA
jgi:hypothetical protein